MISESFFRAQTLMAHGQYPQAAMELTNALAQDPEDPHLLAALASCQNQMGNRKAALDNARKAMGFSGDDNYARGVVCEILLDMDKPKEAEKLAAEGIAMDPEDDRLLSLRGIALFNMRRYKESLATAQTALALDPENESALWLQTQCLSILRKASASDASLEHLSHNPEGVALQSHAFMLLRRGKTKEAYEMFREALRNDPTDESAMAGLKEAVRGRFFLYRWLQAYDFWCQSLGRYWFIPILVVIVGRRVVEAVVRSNPALAPYLIPLGVVFVFLIWGHVILVPLLNALLLVHPYGRFALHPSERWIGRYWILAMSAILVAGLAALLGGEGLAIGLVIYGVAMWVMIGLANLFQTEKRRMIAVHLLATIVNTGAIFGGLLALLAPGSSDP